jgi:hypothetical protein
MSDNKDLEGALNSFTGSVGSSSASPPHTASEATLRELDDFFAQSKNTEHVRRFIESNGETLALVATDGGDDTNTESGLQLYALYKKYAELIEGILEDFVASRAEKEEDAMTSIVAAIQQEWGSSGNAYRLLCTSYIVASLDYRSFLEFAEDLYGTMHYSMATDGDLEDTESNLTGSGYGFDDDHNTEAHKMEEPPQHPKEDENNE